MLDNEMPWDSKEYEHILLCDEMPWVFEGNENIPLFEEYQSFFRVQQKLQRKN